MIEKPEDLSPAEEELWEDAKRLYSFNFERWADDFLFVRGPRWPAVRKVWLQANHFELYAPNRIGEGRIDRFVEAMREVARNG